jgi:hypothetical protein
MLEALLHRVLITMVKRKIRKKGGRSSSGKSKSSKVKKMIKLFRSKKFGAKRGKSSKKGIRKV